MHSQDGIASRKPPFANALREVDEELLRAINIHQWSGSAHEGWAVIFEEVDELWDEVRKRHSERDKGAMRREALQVAATAIRFMVEVCER